MNATAVVSGSPLAPITVLPLRSRFFWVIDLIGLGGHHMPCDASVAATLDNSRGLTALGPNVNDPKLPSLV